MATGTKRGKFVAWGVVLSAVVLAGIGFTTWYAYHSSQVANDALKSANKVSNDIPKLPQIKTYADCQKAPGGKILTSYPAQCVTTSGKTFTDPSAQAQKYLVIKEWGVKIPYTSTDTFTYQVKTSSNGNGVQVSSEQLAKKYDCTNYGAGSIARLRGSEVADPNEDTAAELRATHPGIVTKLGDYYYVFSHDQAQCNDAAIQFQNAANDTIKSSLAHIESTN